jgi:hypothetical protein
MARSDIPDVYDKGDIVTRTFSAKVGAVLTDPTALTLYVMHPRTAFASGTVDTYTWPTGTALITRTGVGLFEIDIPGTEPGTWELKWVPTGAAAGTELDWFYVAPDNFPD